MCLAVSPEGSVAVDVININILHSTNESATLRCIASGGPNNSFMWFFDDELIENETADTLNITKLDGGAYICQVSNAAGSETASVILAG